MLAPLCSLALIACAARTPAPPTPGAQARVFGDAGHGVRRLTQPGLDTAAEDFDFTVRLRRGACLGPCPVYELTLHADGRVDYSGYRHVAVVGTRQGRADPQKLAALHARLAQPQTAALAGDYLRGTPACGLWTSDMPVVRLDVVLDGRGWHIAHDEGCRGAPEALRDLEQAVDDAAGAAQWITGPSR
jgi:hypothetical protein